MKAKILKTEAEYEAALARIEELMDAAADTPEGEELDLLSLVVSHYEEKHYPIDSPSPVAVIEFIMDQNNLTQTDMVPYFGSPSKVSEVLSGKRELSKTMIRKLVERFGVPAEILLEVQPPAKVSYLPSESARLRVAEDGTKYGKKT